MNNLKIPETATYKICCVNTKGWSAADTVHVIHLTLAAEEQSPAC